MSESTRPYPFKLLQRPLLTMWLFLGIVVAGIFMTVAIPGYFAQRGNVFHEDGLLDRMETTERNNHKAKEYRQFLSLRNQNERTVRELDSTIAQLSSELAANGDAKTVAEQIERLRELRAELQADIATKPPIQVVAFDSSPKLGRDLIEWICLLSLLIVGRPPNERRRWGGLFLWSFLLGSALFAIERGPHCIRNYTTLFEALRTVYAYPNVDIDPGSYWVQEITDLALFVITAAILYQWMSFLGQRRRELDLDKDDHERAAAQELLQRSCHKLSATFLHWQVASLLLVSSFFSSATFWLKVVVDYDDVRYQFSALLTQGMWGLSWIVISLPLLVTGHVFYKSRINCQREIGEKLNAPGNSEDDRKRMLAQLEALLAIEPVARWNLIGTSLGLSVPFLVPILNMFR